MRDAEKVPPLRQAKETKNRLLQIASEKVAPLQDAVDLDIATDDEKAQLDEWKKYRVLVNRVDTSTAPKIDWPKKPEQPRTL
ncbi:tail fiber assembly protein [Salmonella enterica]|nr:tail fiber assembly protein [Salmonella enterica]